MLARVDPEVAAATFAHDLQELWATSQPAKAGWELWLWDELHAVVRMRAVRTDGTLDYYYVRLGADYYDAGPPIVTFVTDDGVTRARQGTRFWPVISGVPWFGLHDEYDYGGGRRDQLVCFSLSADYYLSNHNPNEDVRWRQGVHNVAGTLHRLTELLRSPAYQGPSASC